MAFAFERDAYEPTSMYEVIQRWNEITKSYSPGYSLLKQPPRLRITVTSDPKPFKCDNEPLQLVLKTIGMQSVLATVPITHCVNIIEPTSGRLIKVYIQDSLVESFTTEARPGTSVNLYVLFPAFIVTGDPGTNQPLLVTSAFDAA